MNEILYRTKYIQLKATRSKSGSPWVYAHRSNVTNVVIILTVYKDELLFLIEERPPLQAENKEKYAIGLVAGLVGDEREGENLEDAVKAELMEEAGLKAKSIEIKAKKVASSAGCTSETFTIVKVEVEDKKAFVEPISDDGVIIDRIWIKKDKIHDWLKEKEKDGYILTAQALASLFYLYE